MNHDYCRDRIALHDVILNYAAAVDERDIERYKACFSDNVEVVGFGPETYRGRHAWVSQVWSALENYSSTRHLLGPQLATIAGDTAQTRCAVQALHVLAEGSARFTLWGTYYTTLYRVDGRWLIGRHELVVCSTSTE